MRLLHASALLVSGLAATPAAAAELAVSVEIPRLNVAEYHRPYVAIWIERPDQTAAANLAVWYDVGKRGGEGQKWLKDLRQWWRRTGRELTLPADGISGATRAAGTHRLVFAGSSRQLASLPPGDYALVVEAVREVGGRDIVKTPFSWPPKAAATSAAKGSSELGEISLSLKP